MGNQNAGLSEEQKRMIFEAALANVRERHYLKGEAPTWEQLLREAHEEAATQESRLTTRVQSLSE